MTKRIIRVFPLETSYTPMDPLAFIGDPPLLRPVADEVHVSATFTWDIPEAQRLTEAWQQYYPLVKTGGPAYGTACNGFVAGMYVKHGITFTTRGCNNQCPWCLVPEREGSLTEIENFAPGWIIQDNNLLQASKRHIELVFAMLKGQARGAVFAGGLESRLINDTIADQLQSLTIRQLFLAADTKAALKPLEVAIKRLQMPRYKVRVYVLIGYGGETIDQATERLRAVWELGGLPFAQLYQSSSERIKYSREWCNLARTWSRPAAMAAEMKVPGPDNTL